VHDNRSLLSVVQWCKNSEILADWVRANTAGVYEGKQFADTEDDVKAADVVLQEDVDVQSSCASHLQRSTGSAAAAANSDTTNGSAATAAG